jgi:cytochrome P450
VTAQHIFEIEILTSLAFGAIHATCITLTNVLFDLAAYPEYVSELRAEICDVLSKEPDHILHKSAIPKLTKLDSCLRESQRMNPVTISPCLRLLLSETWSNLRDSICNPPGH